MQGIYIAYGVSLAHFSTPKLPLNATVEMGGVNQVTHPVQSLVCWDITLFFFFPFFQEFQRYGIVTEVLILIIVSICNAAKI